MFLSDSLNTRSNNTQFGVIGLTFGFNKTTNECDGGGDYCVNV